MIGGRTKKSAFTLLEMIAAMALMSVLAASLYASLHIAFRARESAAAAVDPVRTAELCIELIREDTESALPPTGILAGEFVGHDAKDDSGRDADTLLFHSSANVPELSERACDIRRVELALAPISDGAELALIRSITTGLLAAEMVEPKEEVLCRGALAFNLRYFDGSDWQDSWDSTTQGDVLPVAVEVTLEVHLPAPTRTAAGSYRVSRVFLLPCSSPAAEVGTRVIRSSP